MSRPVVEVRNFDGRFVGFVTVKSDDKCKACGELLAKHSWVAAENGEHLTCNLLNESA